MTDQPQEEEVVHYHISVTAKQAAAFFVVLLIFLSLAFFFGMRTGAAARRSGAPEPATALSEASHEDRKPVASESSERKGEGEEKKAPKGQPEVSTSRAPEPSFGFATEGDRKPTPELKKTEPTAPKPTPTTGIPAPKPTSAAKAATPSATAKPATGEKPASKDQFFVQVLATTDPAKADQLRKQLKDAGFKTADVSPVPGKTDLFRVRLGPYNEKATAEKVVERLKKPFPNVKPSIVKP